MTDAGERKLELRWRDESASPSRRFREVDGTEPGLLEALHRLEGKLEKNVSSRTSTGSGGLQRDSLVQPGPGEHTPDPEMVSEHEAETKLQETDQGATGLAEGAQESKDLTELREGTGDRTPTESGQRTSEHDDAERPADTGRGESGDSGDTSGELSEALESRSGVDQPLHSGTQEQLRNVWY